MFYKKGIDITKDKEMFNFIKEHFTYYTLNSWNGLTSIANKVKLYGLGLSGDWSVALSLLDNGEYETVNELIRDWEREHPSYTVSFNGRSGGYLVLGNKHNNYSVIPDAIFECEDYDEYKRYCREFYGAVKNNRDELVETVRLIQDFDRLCDSLRDFVDQLSQVNFITNAMELSAEMFNDVYANDLEMMDFGYLSCDSEGVVDLNEVIRLQSLTEAFLRIVERNAHGYKIRFVGDTGVTLENI